MKVHWRDWAWMAVLAVIYFFTAKLGLLVAFPPGNATPVWAPSGIALAAVLLLGNGIWPGVMVGAVLASATITLSFGGAVAIGVGNTLEVLLGAYVVRRWQVAISFSRVRDVRVFLVGAGLASAVAATVGTASVWLGTPMTWRSALLNWAVWWLGDTASIIIVAPLLLIWSRRTRFSHNWRRALEVGLFGAALMIATQAVFGGWLPAQAVDEIPYGFLVFLMWAGFRFGQRLVTASVGLISLAAIWATVHGVGPFADPALDYALLSLQVFLTLFAATGLTFAAEISERRLAEAALRRARDDSEVRVLERTTILEQVNRELMDEIAERKRAEEKLKYVGLHDALTGLYNRAFFEEEITRLEGGRHYPISVLMADVDDLKMTNDNQGHSEGDELLRRGAQVLKSSFRSEDVIARIGGDEFAVLLPDTDTEQAELALAHFRNNLNHHNETDTGHRLSFSLGLSTAHAGRSLLETLKEADDRMYQEKSMHRIAAERPDTQQQLGRMR